MGISCYRSHLNRVVKFLVSKKLIHKKLKIKVHQKVVHCLKEKTYIIWIMQITLWPCIINSCPYNTKFKDYSKIMTFN